MHTIISLPKSIRYIVLELKDQYLEEDRLRPWIIGFSGEKDSTALLQLVVRHGRDPARKKKSKNLCSLQ